MNPFHSPKAKRANTGPGAASTPQRQQTFQQPPASSLVPCPICEKKIPEWFVNNHLDNECSGMESVAMSLSQNSNKRKHEDAVSDFGDLIDERETPPPSRNIQGSADPSTQDPQQSMQSRKDKVNAAVIRAMPLAERGPGGLLRALVLQDTVPSIILWGPCGSGKTTLARIVAHTTKAHFKEMGATTHGVADVKKAAEDAKNLFHLTRQRTIVFLDEIHRFNKAQQDILLPFVEKGTITLIGATTENPSFRVNSALLSRCRVLILKKLSLYDGMDRMIRRAGRIKWRDIIELAREKMSSADLQRLSATFASEQSIDEWADKTLDPGAVKWLVDLSDGDGRSAINTLEMAIQGLSTIILSEGSEGEDSQSTQESRSVLDKLISANISAETVKTVFQKTHLQYDRQGDEHYNLISALHKSIRGSDVDAALYWLGRMLVAGEEPLYIARRMIRLASEDIGLADSSALPLAMATYQACQTIGMPECDVNLAHCVAYMAKAKKSVDVYHAYGLVKSTVSEEYAYPVPIHLRNAPTTLMKDLGFGAEYRYPPSYPEGYEVGQEYMPRGLKRRKFMGQFPVMTEEEARDMHKK
ncbi:Werner helicase interacting protein 1 [Podila verticillata]|nr:Werner helicase interacting protein 1 [Podila verticillata]